MTSVQAGLRAVAPLLLLGTLASASCATAQSQAIGDAILTVVGKAIDKIPPAKHEPRREPFRADPPSVAFGTIAPGASDARTVEIMNQQAKTVTVTAITLAGDDYQLDSLPKLPAAILPGMRVEFRVLFRPRGTGWMNGTMTIRSSGSRQVISISGRAF